MDASVFDFLEPVLTVNAPDEATREAYADFALRFQQLTGPVTAKGAEDTAVLPLRPPAVPKRGGRRSGACSAPA